MKGMRYVLGGMLLVIGSLIIYNVLYAQQFSEQLTRYEFAELLEDMQCRDCRVPPLDQVDRYTPEWLAEQQRTPHIALDDITFGQEYYYCVASTVDSGIMQGFPRSTSPYCPGKFCGTSFLTTAEFIESVVRLLGDQLRGAYAIDRVAVGLRARDAPAVTVSQRAIVVDAIRRCGQEACPATTLQEFDLRLRRCSGDINRCGFRTFGDFTSTNPRTAKANILVQGGVITPNDLAGRFDVMTRSQVERILSIVAEQVVCASPRNDDYDGDGIPNRDDICPYTYDPFQRDMDGDGIGDVCDDDIDGDGIPNHPGVVDHLGNIVPRFFALSEDNCVATPNPDQTQTTSLVFGDLCDPLVVSVDDGAFVALQIDATPRRGEAPLRVDFTKEVVGRSGILQWDFADGTLAGGDAPQHLFLEPGKYTVKVLASADGNQLVSILPVEVLPNMFLQAGLELVSRDLVSAAGDEITLEHISAGAVSTIMARVGTDIATITPGASASLTLPDRGMQFVEMQAYNASGQRVALSQLSIDTMRSRGSQLHTSSLDPIAGSEVNFTTIYGGFEPEEVLNVLWHFGDTAGLFQGEMVTTYAWESPGVYPVKQTIQFRDRTVPDHENVLTVMVLPDSLGKQLRLSADELIKGTAETFTFTLDIDDVPIDQMVRCERLFTSTEKRIFTPVSQEDLTQPFSYGVPGSYPVSVLCQTDDEQWYHTAVTVAVTQDDVCLTNPGILRCDLDGDGVPDLCDDDIDGDGLPNRMNLVTRELPDCSFSEENIDKSLWDMYMQAIAQGAPFDPCPFNQTNTQVSGAHMFGSSLCALFDPFGETTLGTGVIGGTGGSTSLPSGTGGVGTGGGAGAPSAGATTGGPSGGGASAGGPGGPDSDGDGVPDSIDACPNTPGGAGGVNGCPPEPQNEANDPTVPQNPLIEVQTCTQCPCPAADYGSSLWKGDRVRALLLDEGGSIIYRYSTPEIIHEDIPGQLLGER